MRALPQADDTAPVALVSWLTNPRPHLGGRSRAQALAERYDVDASIAEAASLGVPAGPRPCQIRPSSCPT